MVRGKRHLLVLDRELRPYGYTREDKPRGSDHWTYNHKKPGVQPVTASGTPRNPDDEIRTGINKAKANLRAAGLPPEPKHEPRGARTDHTESDTVRALELLPNPGWASIEELAEMLGMEPNNRLRRALTMLTMRGALTTEPTEDGRVWRLTPRAEPKLTSRKDLEMTTVEETTPAEVLALDVASRSKLVRISAAVMIYLEGGKQWASATDLRNAVVRELGDVSVEQVGRVASKHPRVVSWRERRKQGQTFYALEGVVVPNANQAGKLRVAPDPVVPTPRLVTTATASPKAAAVLELAASPELATPWERVQTLLDEIVAGEVHRKTAQLQAERDEAREKLEAIQRVMRGE